MLWDVSNDLTATGSSSFSSAPSPSGDAAGARTAGQETQGLYATLPYSQHTHAKVAGIETTPSCCKDQRPSRKLLEAAETPLVSRACQLSELAKVQEAPSDTVESIPVRFLDTERPGAKAEPAATPGRSALIMRVARRDIFLASSEKQATKAAGCHEFQTMRLVAELIRSLEASKNAIESTWLRNLAEQRGSCIMSLGPLTHGFVARLL